MKYDEAQSHLMNGKSVYRDGWTVRGWLSLKQVPVFVGITLDTAKEARVVFYDESASDGSYIFYGPTLEDLDANDWHVYGELETKPEAPKAPPKPPVAVKRAPQKKTATVKK